MTDKDMKRTIAENVRRFRGERTLTDVANSCSTDEWKCYPAMIQQIESGKSCPTAWVLVRVAEALDVTPNDLVFRASQKNSPHAKPSRKRASAATSK